MRRRRQVLTRSSRWLADDFTRSLLALPFVAVAVVAASLVPGLLPAGAETLGRLLVLYTVLLLAYPGLTLLAFSGLSGARLTHALGEARRRHLRRPTWMRKAFAWRDEDDDVGGDGPSWPVLLAFGSLGLAVWLVVSEPMSGSGFLIATTIVMIVLAWGGSVVAYAVHVARLDAVSGGLRFPGDGPEPERHFSDYLYLSLGVQAAFGPSDVHVTTPRMRRTLSGHMLVGWIFNTVVVAALVSFLVGMR